MRILQGRLGQLLGQSSGYVENLPKDVKRRLKALQNLQDENLAINAELRKEISALEKKYLKKHQPIYAKRQAIVSGQVEPTDEECKRQEEDQEEEEEAEEEKKEEVTGVPQFWLTALMNLPMVSEIITEDDVKALESLTDIKVEYIEGNAGFKLIFEFAENDYFENKVLTKSYFLEEPADPGVDDFIFDRAEGSDIEWKAGKNLSVRVEIKKQRHKQTQKTRVVKKNVPNETFFKFFTPPAVPEDEEFEDEEELNQLEELTQIDYEMGELIKEKLVPRAVDWFTGKALEYEDDEFQDGEGFYDEEDDDEDDEDDDEDEEDGGAGEKAPECKQQ